MPGITVSDQYDALLSTTLRNYRKQLINNILGPMRFLKWLMRARANGKETGTFDLQDGGYEIMQPVMYGTNSTFDFYSGYETIDTTPQEGITVCRTRWAELGGTIAISRREQRQNSTKHQILNLLKAKVEQAEMSAKDKLNSKLFANISAEPATDINSILLFASNTPSTTTACGISGNTYSWWRNYQADVGAYATNLEDKMRVAVNTVGKWAPVDFWLCTQTAYEYYESLGTSQKRFPMLSNEKATLDLGFDVLKYKGADLFFDFDFATATPVTGESMICGSSKHLKLIMDKERNFTTGDFVQPENQTAKVAIIDAMGNLFTNLRASLGLLHGIDAS